METWRSSLNRHPLDVVFKNGSREYMAEMNLKEKMSLTLKKIRNFLKNPKKRILEMKRLFYGQKPVLKYSLIGIICLVIMLVLLKIVSCCWKAKISKKGYKKLENIDIENWNCSSGLEYKDNKICTEIIKWLIFFKVTGFEAKNKNLLLSSLLFLFGAIFILCSFVVNWKKKKLDQQNILATQLFIINNNKTEPFSYPEKFFLGWKSRSNLRPPWLILSFFLYSLTTFKFFKAALTQIISHVIKIRNKLLKCKKGVPWSS